MTTRAVFIMFMLIIGSPSWSEAGEYLNRHLPSWINVDLEFRHRYEWRSNFDFNDAVYDKDGFNLWRSRLGLTLKPHKNVKVFYQLQDARVSDDSTRGSKSAFEDWMETRQLWAEGQLKDVNCRFLGTLAVSVRGGRQELSFGSQRLIGPVNWSNVGQVFDAGKFSLKSEEHHWSLDAFGGGKVLVKAPREPNDLYEGSADDTIGGYYGSYSGFKDTTVEQYVISRNTDGKTVSYGQTGDGELEDYTIGGRIKGKLPNTSFDYEIEAAKQVGNSGSLDADAQMAVVIFGYTWGHAWRPRLGFEFDYASGDGDRTDGKRRTFDNLYPTNHLFYGYMDFVSLQNINNYRLQFNVFPHTKWELEANLHLIYLDTPKDNLYAANQTIKRSSVSGAGTHVGDEIDFLTKYKLNNYTSIWVGYSHFFTGNFLKDTGPFDDADFFYAQTTISF